MLKEELTVIVSSCDRYRDILRPFSQCFRRFWPDCPCRVLLTTETKPQDLTDCVFDDVAAPGADKSWSERLLAALEMAPTDYVLLVLDDFFLSAPVPTERLEELLEITKKYHAAHLRLEPLPKPQKRISEAGLGEYVKGKAYRISAQIAIWDKAYLRQLLTDLGKCELWFFERNGSFLCEQYEQPCLGSYETIMPFVEIICAARWLVSGVKFCRRENISIQRELRPDEPFSFWLYRMLRGIPFHICPTLITKVKLQMNKGKTGGR